MEGTILQDVDLDTWIAPGELAKKFPYYLSGLDRKGQPVFVVEVGKWDMRTYFEEGGDEKIANLYIDQLLHRLGSISKKENNFIKIESDSGLYGVIADYKGFEERQATHDQTLNFLLTFMRKMVAGVGKQLDYDIVINLQEPGGAFVDNVIAPIFGSLFSKVEVYGTNDETWIPALLERISKESLAPWYGGPADTPFRPLSVFESKS